MCVTIVSAASRPHPGKTKGLSACRSPIRAHSSTAPSVRASRPHCSTRTSTSGTSSKETSAYNKGPGGRQRRGRTGRLSLCLEYAHHATSAWKRAPYIKLWRMVRFHPIARLSQFWSHSSARLRRKFDHILEIAWLERRATLSTRDSWARVIRGQARKHPQKNGLTWEPEEAVTLERGRWVKDARYKAPRFSQAERERTVLPPAGFEALQVLGVHHIRRGNHDQLTVVTKGNSFRSSARTETLPRKNSSSNLTVPAGTLAFSRLEAFTLTPTRRPCVAISRSTLNDMHCVTRLHRPSPQPGEAGEAGSSTWARYTAGGGGASGGGGGR